MPAALLDARLGAARRSEVSTGSSPRRAATRWRCWSCPTELSPAQLSGAAPLPGAAPPDRPGRAGLPRPEPAGYRRRCRRVLLLAAADDSGEPRRGRGGPRPTLGLAEHDLEARVESGLLVDERTSLSRASPAWSARRSTRPRPEPERRQSTGPSRMRWPATGTPTARPGTVPRPPRVRTRRSSPPWSWSAPGPSDAAGTPPRWRRTNARQHCATTPPSAPTLTFAAARSAWACGRVGQAQALLSQAREATERPAAAGRHRAAPGSHRGQHRLGDRGAPDLRRGRAARSSALDPASGAGDGVAAAIMRTYGADSGAPLPATDALGRTRRRRSTADRCA